MTALREPTTVFTALAEGNRLAITEMLCERGPMSAGTICSQFSISAPAISQHLRVLREARLVNVKRDGQMRLYSINNETIGKLGRWVGSIQERLQSRYDTLEEILNEGE